MTLGERLKEIQIILKITNKDIIYRTGLADAMVDSLRNDRSVGRDMRTMVKLCAGLGLPPSVSHELCALAGVALNSATRQNHAYRFIIDTMFGKTAEYKERFLESIGLPRLDIQDDWQKLKRS